LKLRTALAGCLLACFFLNFTYRALMPAAKVELGLSEAEASLALSLLLVG